MQQQFGKVIAIGTEVQIALVKLALDECVNMVTPLQDVLPRVYTIEFKAPDLMIEGGAIIPGSKSATRPNGIAAEGFVKGSSLLWINAKVAKDKPWRARHIVRHELSHILPLSLDKKSELMSLMWNESGKHPTKWRGQIYQGRPEECHADTLAEAMSGKDSPWDDFAFFMLDVKDTDVHKFLDITFRVDPVTPQPPLPPEPEPEPEPLPPEPDYVTALRLNLQEREARLNTIASISALPK